MSYRALPRPQFSTLQSRLFPVYFTMSTALSVILPITYPGGGLAGPPSGVAGVLAEGNRWKVLVPLATMFVTNLVNTVYLGPVTTRIMKERKHQGMRVDFIVMRHADVGKQKQEMERRVMMRDHTRRRCRSSTSHLEDFTGYLLLQI